MQMHSPVCVYISTAKVHSARARRINNVRHTVHADSGCEENTRQLSSLEPCACSEGAYGK